MNLVFGSEGLNLWALAAPLLVISLPCMGLIAAFAVLFESVSWLRGGLGNIIYFFAFLFALISTSALTTVGTPGFKINPFNDFTGWQITGIASRMPPGQPTRMSQVALPFPSQVYLPQNTFIGPVSIGTRISFCRAFFSSSLQLGLSFWRHFFSIASTHRACA
jgi:hypothetical protein